MEELDPLSERTDMQLPEINLRLQTIPALIAEVSEKFDIARIALDKLEANITMSLDPVEHKNQEQRTAAIKGNEEYIEQAQKVAHLKAQYYQKTNEMNCVIEIARNRRSELGSHLIDNIKE